MARTRSKSNLEASISSRVGTPVDTGTVRHTSTLNSSTPSVVICEGPIRASVESGCVQLPLSSSDDARISRLAAMRAVHQLRDRLDAIDEHSRELRDARRILVKREGALVKERDELVEHLRSVELTLLAGDGLAPTRACHTEETTDVVEDDLAAEFEPPSKRKVTNSSVTAPPMVESLAPAPTLIQACPVEFQHASASLPRPLEAPKTPQSSPNSKSSVRRNGIRFPPGSAPRRPHARSRSSSPFTQMLPPLVPVSATASPATPKPTKLYEPLIGDLDAPLFTPVPGFQSPKRTLPALPPRPVLTPDARIPSSNGENVTIPTHLFAYSPPVPWEVAYMGPERTPSPPIGVSRLTWAPNTGVEGPRRFVEPEQSVLELKAGGLMVDNSKEEFGPALRTRARLSNVITTGTGKGKGRA
ncbi:hypothetical protein FRC06_000399 [Ceratobasidium sp. 370]|nr:hypothetical protein FRC06_000399 [Ceratobasidium sp. 370]